MGVPQTGQKHKKTTQWPYVKFSQDLRQNAAEWKKEVKPLVTSTWHYFALLCTESHIARECSVIRRSQGPLGGNCFSFLKCTKCCPSLCFYEISALGVKLNSFQHFMPFAAVDSGQLTYNSPPPFPFLVAVVHYKHTWIIFRPSRTGQGAAYKGETGEPSPV